MEASSLSSSILPPSLSSPAPSSGRRHRLKMRFRRKKRPGFVVVAARRDYEYEGQLVDSGMIHLRKRIMEIKMMEGNCELPEEWSEWEKQYYTAYSDFVCKVVGLLQLFLMNIRPSLAIGILAIILISVPVSTVTIGFRLLNMVNGSCFSSKLTP